MKRNFLLIAFLLITFFCSANLALAETASTTNKIINGVCGSVEGTTVSSIPTENLCNSGNASTVFGPNPGFWWYCEGVNGGEKVACQAKYLSKGSIKITSPTGGEKWKIGKTYAISWDYTSLKGDVFLSIFSGKNYSCGLGSASVESKQLIFTLGKNCEYSGKQAKRTMDPGEYIINIIGYDVNGKKISYTMEAGNPIYVSVETITGSPINGACGSANGKNLTIAPAENLCSSGIASTVTGDGPWNWNCNGLNNGVAVSCKATGTAVEVKSEMVITSPAAGAVLPQGSKNIATWTGSIPDATSYTVCLTGSSLGNNCMNLGTVEAKQSSFTWVVPSNVNMAKSYQLSFTSSNSKPVFSPSFSIGSAATITSPIAKAPTTVDSSPKSTPQDISSISLTKPINQMTKEELINILMAIVQALSQQKRVTN